MIVAKMASLQMVRSNCGGRRVSGVARCFQSRLEARKLATQGSSLQTRGAATSNLSYVDGPTEPPLLQQTVPEHFASIVSRYGDKLAVMARSPTDADLLSPTKAKKFAIPETTTLTYYDLDSLSNTLAHSLRSLGVKKGDRVAVSLGNITENMALAYAMFKLGAILVPLNPGFTSTQIGAALSHLGVEVLIIGAVTDLPYKPCEGRSNLSLLQGILPNMTRKIESPDVPSLKKVVILDNTPSHPKAEFPVGDFRALTPFTELLSGPASNVTPDSSLNPDETINIQFTSGTTSVPKAAMLSHTSILNNGALIASRMGLTPDDRIVVPPPLFHCFGSVLGSMATATTGAAILFPSPAFHPAASLRMAAEQNATGLYGVPTMFIAELELLQKPALTNKLPKDAFSQLRKGIAAGSSVPENLMLRIYDKLGLQDLVICYGMTETSPVSVMTSPQDPFKKRTVCVGKAMPHTAIKIVDPYDRNRIVPIGERGELAASGYLVMKGYYNDEARTSDDRVVDAEGHVWMYSGDEARMDAEGYITITGRIKDLIIRGGENIHPAEIENILFQCPGIQEVSVVGVPDETYGEVVSAFVILEPQWKLASMAAREPEDNATFKRKRKVRDNSNNNKNILSRKFIRDWVRDRLSKHLVPRYVWQVDEFPKTLSGKIQKFKLREMAVERLKQEKIVEELEIEAVEDERRRLEAIEDGSGSSMW
ncbi:uncharacterized protein BCR38DRAFT_452017 [Pseudomassariella vexata]|uniref:AMP-binding enzyme n=1 Tax=Pseudomassariella vexata TaxID=1141098 RepID=A0A1Y2D8X8_9PEZI|nr:uncharacterized protein BCR38DRAFT_452017 [Pseudomassariella vexata]ORY55634.1 hypothetical protein BCR38DRAFT_452017 [Pseudomassariella vexata]